MPRPRRGKQIVMGVLNIAASPHPLGYYAEMLEKIADIEVDVMGNERAKITKPRSRPSDPDILHGQILLWTNVDKDGPWLDKKTNKEATDRRKSEINIPEALQPNFRPFSYAFSQKKHRLIFEVKNELGQNLGHRRAEKIFSELLSPGNLGADDPEVNVTVIPEDDSVENILKIPTIRRIEIVLKRPNPDDLGDEAEKLLKELEHQGAKTQTVILTKAAKVDTIELNEDNLKLAQVAASNGHVKAKGADENGNTVEESTKEYPKRITVDVSDDQSAGVRFLNALARLL